MAQVQIHARGNMSVNERDDLVKAVEREILAMNSEHGELRSVYSVTKADIGGRSGGEELAEDVIGTIALEFGDWDKRRKVDAILDDIRTRTAPIPGIQIELTKEDGGPGGGKAVALQLTSPDFVALEAAADIVRKKLEIHAWPGRRAGFAARSPASNGSSMSIVPRPRNTASM